MQGIVLNPPIFMSKEIKMFFSILFFIFVVFDVFAQSITGRIIGRVVSNEGAAISDVQIRIGNIDENIFTDKEGKFVVEKVDPGIYDIKLDRIGFESKFIDNIQVTKDSTYDTGTIVLTARFLPFDEIIVTATRIENLPFEVSKPLNIVSSAQIKERAARTSAEALREETGIFVQKTNHGSGSAIIRGLGSNQILILVDGIRLNNSTYRLGNHQYLTTIDPNSLNQIEVVRGPNSVLYGSDAIGGTINLITQKPAFSSSGAKTDFRFLSRYATADEEKTNHGEASLSSKRWVLMSGFTVQDLGDLKRGNNSRHVELEKSKNGIIQSPTGFRSYDADFKLIFNSVQDQYWTLAYQLCRQVKVPRYDKYENEDYYRWFYNPQKRDLLYLTFENHFKNRYFQKLQASILG
jgi:hemoglobin/transferrin/lactoferrin receptor protein